MALPCHGGTAGAARQRVRGALPRIAAVQERQGALLSLLGSALEWCVVSRAFCRLHYGAEPRGSGGAMVWAGVRHEAEPRDELKMCVMPPP